MDLRTFWLSFLLLGIVQQSLTDSSTQASEKPEINKALKASMLEYLNPESMSFFSGFLDEATDHVAFKIVVPAKEQECFYEKAPKYTHVNFMFECLTPPTFSSPGKISAYVDSVDGPSVRNIEKIENKREGSMNVKVMEEGTYSFCVDNGLYSVPKVVQLSIDISKVGEVAKYHMQQQMGNNTVYHIFDQLYQVSQSLTLIRSAILHTRSLVRYDAVTLMSNLTMVTRFSILSVLLILGVCAAQLHIVKRMFIDPKV